MDKINGAGHVGRQFVIEDAGLGRPPTEITADWLNGVQGEIVTVIEGAGLALSSLDNTQLSQAIAKMIQAAQGVGTLRNDKMVVAAASATATFTADEVVVESALGGAAYKIANVNKVINLAITGAGGMDTGLAPVSGYVAIYAIYNPTSGVSALLAVNASAAAAPNVYGGANMPAGYTASTLVSVWPTGASRQFKIGVQVDRCVSFPLAGALSTSVSAAAYTSLSIAGIVPPNARTVSGALQASNSLATSQQTNLYVAPDTNGTGAVLCVFAGGTAGGGAVVCPFSDVPVITNQTIYYLATCTAGTPSYLVYINGYTF